MAPATIPQQATSISLDDRLREVEASLIGWALRVNGGNKSRAAELLQVKRSTLGDRINRCGLGKLAVETVSSSPTAVSEKSHTLAAV